MKRAREMSSQLFVILYTLYIYPYAHLQLTRHIPNPFCEFPCSCFIYFQLIYKILNINILNVHGEIKAVMELEHF